MPRNITVTFDDGSSHVYQNAPDDVTPDSVAARAQKEFGKSIVSLDGGRKPQQQVTSQPAASLATPPISKPTTEQPSALTQFGRGAASLADNTIGAVIPAAVQQFGYPFARLGRSAEEAQAITQDAVSAVNQPFGKAFGVQNTPEYKSEASARLMQFIGNNVHKGAEWLASKTGIPASDVENMMGSLTIAAPKVLPAVTKATTPAVSRIINDVTIGAKMPFEKQLAARAERASNADYARGAQIDAVKDAQRLGIPLNPSDVSSSASARIVSTVAGDRGKDALREASRPIINDIARREMGMPANAPLSGKAGQESFRAAEEVVAAPYRELEALPAIVPTTEGISSLNKLRPDPSRPIIGEEAYAGKINRLIDSAVTNVEKGLSGKSLHENIRVQRQKASDTLNNQAATDVQKVEARTRKAIADQLEAMIPDADLRTRYAEARQQLAKIRTYKEATDFNKGNVDALKISKLTSENNPLTGDIEAVGRIAGNFPGAFSPKVEAPWYSPPRFTRAGTGAATGALIGGQLGGTTGAAVGTILGALGGEGASIAMAKRIASPSYQNALRVKDARIVPNQLATASQQQPRNEPVPNDRAVVPYVEPIEVLDKGQGQYPPNFTIPKRDMPPRAKFVGPDEMTNLLEAPSAEKTMQGLRAEDARKSTVLRELDRIAEAEANAKSVAGRKPASREVVLDHDPITGKLVDVSRGVKGATPETFRNFGSSLESAAKKIADGRKFDLTSEERIAWDRMKADIEVNVNQYTPRSSDAMFREKYNRYTHNQTIEQIVKKARDEAAAFDAIAQKRQSLRSVREAQISRDRLMDIAEALDAELKAPKRKSTGKQGVKTQTFNRHKLNMISDQDVVNQLIMEKMK